MTELHPELRRGDAYLHNSPYHGNTHAADHTILVPVIDDAGVHRFTAVAKAHQADCGNALPTTYMASARDIYAEGALLFPAVKVQEDYEHIHDILRMCRLRIRAPDQWWADYLALMGAARIAERKVMRLAEEVGWETLEAYSQAWFDYSEQMMIDTLRKLPSGRFTTTAKHDPFPGAPDGVPITATVEVRSEDAMIEVDLRDNIDCLPNGINTSMATARSSTLTGIFNSLPTVVPNNAGSFRRIKIHMREGAAVGIPKHPACCSVATTALANRLGGAIQRGMASLGEGIGAGDYGYIMSPTMAVISGKDPRRKHAPFVNQIFVGHPGGGANPELDGWLNIGDLGAGAMLMLDSVEVDEQQYPIRVDARYIVPDTEGAGRRRGAPSTYAEFAPVDCTIESMHASDGSVNPALGTAGGGAGATATQFKRESDGSLTTLDLFTNVTVEDGTAIITQSCAGGGYGNPHEREIERVRKDVVEGWITPARARDVYGVAVDKDGVVDEEGTAVLRSGRPSDEGES